MGGRGWQGSGELRGGRGSTGVRSCVGVEDGDVGRVGEGECKNRELVGVRKGRGGKSILADICYCYKYTGRGASLLWPSNAAYWLEKGGGAGETVLVIITYSFLK